ncbi:serine hydrolase domain-containing protein [Luteibacter aegosomatissinici]|uniref:serine hydrolase domain-containing protein n=1 Tax=Luteibacter aegosomatissinici TaxID=2911539 RepID=UPI001FFB88D8|nr:serine hydrolase [Luteibacter aegosomatissinici]UPG96639.1 beta-lactamase family protein [Luteibacter aegosomatissinici]
MRKPLLVTTSLVLGLAIAAWAVYRPDQAIRVAAGVAAHHVCSMTYVGHQDPDTIYRELVTPMIGSLPAKWLTVHVDRERQAVAVDGLVSTLATATFTPGYGCRLDLPGNTAWVADTHVAPDIDDGFAAAGLVATDKPTVAAAMERVFAEHRGDAPKAVKAVVIVKDGKVVAERYAQGYGIRSKLISFSVAKSFTNALLGMLALDGKVDPKQPLGALEWQTPGDPRAAITIEDLMRMQSGLAAEEAESAFSPVAQMEFLHADMAGFAAAQPAKEAPGKTFEYTSADTVLLDRMLGQRIGGGAAGVRAFARQRLFAPLHMGDVTMEYDGQGTFIGSTYVYATARDYARLGLLYLNDGKAPDGSRLLPEGWVAWSRTSALGAPYGAGFWTNDGPSDVAQMRVEGGFPKDGFFASGTMGQRIYIVPSEHLVITRFGYSAPPTYGIEDDVRLIKAAIAAYR